MAVVGAPRYIPRPHEPAVELRQQRERVRSARRRAGVGDGYARARGTPQARGSRSLAVAQGERLRSRVPGREAGSILRCAQNLG